MKKETLFEKLRQNTREQYDLPDLHLDAIAYFDVIEQFVKMTESVGGRALRIRRDDDVNSVVRGLYPDAKIIASNLPYITIANRNPDRVGNAAELNGTDVAILQGEVGVAENGCVWVPQTMKEKAVCFISEELVIILDAANIVNNMHEGYQRIQVPETGYGCWISGPSKTADIEQALVMGAQAARGVVVLVRE